MIGNLPQDRIGLDLPRRLISVDDGKLYVHENKVGPAFRRHCHSFLAVAGLHYLEPRIGQKIIENTSVVLGIFDDENAFTHATCLWREASS